MKTIVLDGEIYHINSSSYSFLVECLTYRNLYDSLVISENGFSLKDSLTPSEKCRVMDSILDLTAAMVGEIVIGMDEEIQQKWNTGIGRSLAHSGALIDILMKKSSYEKASTIIKRLLRGVTDFNKYLENLEMQAATLQDGKEFK